MGAQAAVRPYHREGGTGEAVVCLHSNASSSGQWRALIECLSPQYRVIAPDAYGAGRSPPWPTDRAVGLADEVALLEPLLADVGGPLRLVGHSYGGAVAALAALHRTTDLRALVLYEPTLFSLLDNDAASRVAVQGIREAAADAAAAVDAGDLFTAAEHFIDYWMGAGQFRSWPESRQSAVAASMDPMRGWANALFHEPTPLAAFAQLTMPVLLMVGGRSPPSSRAVAQRLASVLPQAELLEFPQLGHLGPVTDPQPVNEAIVRFLQRT